MVNIKRQLQIQDEDDQSPGPEPKRTRPSNSAETRASPDTKPWNEEEIDAELEYEVDNDLPLIRHHRHMVVSASDSDLSSAGEADISDRNKESNHIHGARREDDDAISDQVPSFEDEDERNVAGASNRQAVLMTPSATPSIESAAGASIQWPVLLTESEKPSRWEEEKVRQRTRAKNKELVSRGLKGSTVGGYSPCLIRWETFCDKFYRGDQTIKSEKILHFLKADLFLGKPTTIKVDDKRNLAIGRTTHDPFLQPTEAKAEAAMIRSRFEAAMSEPNIREFCFMSPITKSRILTGMTALSFEDNHRNAQINHALKPTSARDVRHAINVYIRSLVPRFAKGAASGGTKEQASSSNEVRQSARSKQQTVVHRSQQKKVHSTRKVSFSGTRPALTRTAKPGPISVAKPASSTANKTLTKSTPKPVDTSNSCTRVMGSFFERRTIAHSTHIRNRVIFALERHLLVPCQDLLTLDLADIFMEHFDITHNGSTCKVPGLAICVRSGQQLLSQDSPVVVALRHKDHRSCAVGAVAFYFFDRFQLRGEPFPDLTNTDEWPRIKLLRNKDILQPTSIEVVEEASRYTQEAYSTQDQGLGQSTGAIGELEGLGIRVEGPRKMGPNGETPRWLAALAGYHNEPYHLNRDMIPPLELQRQIFPMIESQHGSMDPAQWRAHCNEIMKDPLASPGSGLEQGVARLRRLEAAHENMDEYLGVARLDLLHFFLWLRRIVLQDMALFICENWVNDLIRHEIFDSPEFVRFQTDLLEKMEGQVPMPSQDRGSAIRSSPTVQHDRRDSGTSSRALASHFQPERRRSRSHQRLLDEQSQEVDKTSSNELTHSDRDLHEKDLDDHRVASQGLQQWIDRDCRQQQQSYRALSDLLQREQDRQQKSHERELRRIQQDHEQEKLHLGGRIVGMEQKLDQQSEQLRLIRQRMVRQDAYIKDLEKAQRDELLELEWRVTAQADQTTWHEQRLLQLEGERDNRRREQLTQRQRGLDQRALEMQQLGPRPSGVKRQGATWGGTQKNRDAGVATGLKAVSKSQLNDEVRVPGQRVSEAILLDHDEPAE